MTKRNTHTYVYAAVLNVFYVTQIHLDVVLEALLAETITAVAAGYF